MSVIDASVWVSYLLPQDVNHLVSRQWLEEFIASGRQSTAPTLMLVEVAGAIARRTGRPAQAHEAVAQLSQLRTLRLIGLNRHNSLIAAQLAADLQLRGADAVYAATAQSLRLPLITWDQELLDRAGRLIEVRIPEIP